MGTRSKGAFIPTKLYPYQRKGIALIQNFGGRCLIADEMGLGKTLQSLYWAWKHDEGRNGPIVVVCQATVKRNWRREARRHLDMDVTVLNGRKPTIDVSEMDRNRVYVINYDILGATQPWKTKKRKDTWGNFLKDIQPWLVIIDECQYIKERESKRTKAVKELCRRVPHVIALSGTPILNRPAEFWPTLNILRPDVFNSYMAFAMRYCELTKEYGKWVAKGCVRTKELNQLLLNTCMIRRLKADVLKDLPAIRRSIIPLEMDDPQTYYDAVREYAAWVESATRLAKRSRKYAKLMQAERLSKLGFMKRLAGRSKLQSAIAMIREFLESTEEKLIVFGIHKRVIAALMDEFGDVAVKVDGSVTGPDRDRAIDAFNKNPRIRLFIGNIQAAGVGWSCTSATEVWFIEIGWTPGEHNQAEARVHGIGRGIAGVRVLIRYLVAEGTIEEWLCKFIQSKQGNLDAVVDGGRDTAGFNVYSLFEQVLLQKGRQSRAR